jgi:pantoate--beta-alanine ligase
MILFKHSKDLQFHLHKIKKQKITTGFVPTMGALHAGHLALIAQSKLKTGLTICSIFVNPVQFNNPDDYKKYPITIEKDILLLEENGCDILFLPEEEEIYPNTDSKNKHYELGYLETVLEGKFRPGHFQGVCMAVERLLEIVEPDYLFLGQKDYQQCLIIKRLVELMKKNIRILISPTLREPSGLALSSRNLRLSPDEKNIASELYKTLEHIKINLPFQNLSQLKNDAIKHLESIGFIVDYLEIARPLNLTIADNYKTGEDLIILVAAFLNNVRLIDNLIVTA